MRQSRAQPTARLRASASTRRVRSASSVANAPRIGRRRSRAHDLDRVRRDDADRVERSDEANEVEVALAGREAVRERVFEVVGHRRLCGAVVDLDRDDLVGGERAECDPIVGSAEVMPCVDAEPDVASRRDHHLARSGHVRDVRRREELDRDSHAVLTPGVRDPIELVHARTEIAGVRTEHVHVAGTEQVCHVPHHVFVSAASVETERLELVDDKAVAVERLQQAIVGPSLVAQPQELARRQPDRGEAGISSNTDALVEVDIAEAVLTEDEVVGTEAHRDLRGCDPRVARRRPRVPRAARFAPPRNRCARGCRPGGSR